MAMPENLSVSDEHCRGPRGDAYLHLRILGNSSHFAGTKLFDATWHLSARAGECIHFLRVPLFIQIVSIRVMILNMDRRIFEF